MRYETLTTPNHDETKIIRHRFLQTIAVVDISTGRYAEFMIAYGMRVIMCVVDENIADVLQLVAIVSVLTHLFHSMQLSISQHGGMQNL